jgi:hypothetical protein
VTWWRPIDDIVCHYRYYICYYRIPCRYWYCVICCWPLPLLWCPLWYSILSFIVYCYTYYYWYCLIVSMMLLLLILILLTLLCDIVVMIFVVLLLLLLLFFIIQYSMMTYVIVIIWWYCYFQWRCVLFHVIE